MIVYNQNHAKPKPCKTLQNLAIHLAIHSASGRVLSYSCQSTTCQRRTISAPRERENVSGSRILNVGPKGQCGQHGSECLHDFLTGLFLFGHTVLQPRQNGGVLRMLDQDSHRTFEPCPEHVHELFVHLGQAVGELIVLAQ